jgi:hypothetical protein
MSGPTPLPRSSMDAGDAWGAPGVPDPATDPLTRPVIDRLERFHAATWIEPPVDIAARVRDRLAGEPPRAPQRSRGMLAALAPRNVRMAFRTSTAGALGRGRQPRSVRIQGLVTVALMILCIGVLGVAAALLLRSTADRVGGPASSPATPSASAGPSPSPSPAGTSFASPAAEVVDPAPDARQVAGGAIPEELRSTRGDAVNMDQAGAPGTPPSARSDASSHGIGGVASSSSAPTPQESPAPEPDPGASAVPIPSVAATSGPTPEPTPDPTAAPTPEPTPEPSVEPTAGPRPEPTPGPTVEPTAGPTPEPTPSPTPEPTVEPTVDPTAAPTPEPTPGPTPEPTPEPTPRPTQHPDERTPEPEPTERPADDTPHPTDAPGSSPDAG